jgi:hypothetical protein
MKRISITAVTIIGGLVFASLFQAVPLAAQNEPAGVIAIDNSQENYPDGSKWPMPQYEKPRTALRLKAESMVHGFAVKSDVSSGIQAELPAEITLGPAEAFRFSQDVPSARLTGTRVADATQTTDSSAPQLPATQATVKWIIDYPVQYKGVPLSEFSDVLVIADGDGQVQYLRKRNLPRAVDATAPTVDKTAAAGVGTAHAKEAFRRADVKTGEPKLEVWVDPNLRGHLAWSFTVESDSVSDPRIRRYWVSAVGAPQVLYYESLIYSTHFGTVSGTLWPQSPFQPTVNNPLPSLTVNRTGGGGGSVVTGADGRYGFPSGGGLATINTTLSGPNSVIVNLAGAVMTRSQSGTPASAIDLNFGASTEFEFSQVSAFYWTNFIHEFAKDILAPTDLVALPTTVNRNATCNAFWNGSSINFFRAGGGCPNTAYSDVVLHEYGHGIDQMKGGIVDGRYSEGFGDSMAILGTRQPCVGRDFFGPGTCLRPATNVDLWPSSSPDPHEVGKRYMEFVWQLVQELKKNNSDDESFDIAKRLVLGAALANPLNIPDAVRLSFIVDDDDGNLANGTPHCRELAAAADSRNLPHPACPPDKLAYAWANSPNAASYTPSLPYSYNSAGGPITVTRSGEGDYAVKFAGLGGNGLVGGNVQVTPYGSGREHCKVLNWSSGGPDFIANVRCFNSIGIPDDTRFTILVIWR